MPDWIAGPLFDGIAERYKRDPPLGTLPRLASEWMTLTGWVDSQEIVLVPPHDAREFEEALSGLSSDDVAKHCTDCNVDECLSHATAVREFIRERLGSCEDLFIEAW